jgi:tetratricopeptide (TPR) repeat protein
MAGPVLAQPQHGEGSEPSEQTRSPENPEAAQQARAHYRRGMQHFEQRAFRAAIREFELAAKAVPSADLWYNIARAHEELSEYEPAIKYYRRYLRDKVDPPDRKDVEEHIAQLQERLKARREAEQKPDTGTLRIEAKPEGAAIRVDGDRVGRAPLRIPLNLSPGKHQLVVSREGYAPFRAAVRVEPGVTTGAYADLQPATRYRSVRGDRIWSWVVGGLAVGALGTSLGLGIKAGREQDDNLRDAREWSTYSDYALGAGMGLGVAAAVLWFLEGRAVDSKRISGPPHGSEAP